MGFSLRRALAGAALCVSSLLVGSPSLAEPSASQKETARGLMAEGRELRDRGDASGALKRFLAADALMRVPTTGFEVGATQALLGQLVEARDTLRKVLALPRGADDPEPFNEARVRAQKLDQELMARIGALSFSISGSGTSEVSVAVDGASVPGAALSHPFRVNPGRHVVVARSEGRELRREVIAVEGDTMEVQLHFPAPSAAIPSSPPAVATKERALPDDAPPEKGWPTLAYVGGGVALIGIVAGSVTGISAISHKNAAKRGCVDGSCPPSTWSDLDSAHSMATASTVGFAAGAIGVGVALSAVLLEQKPSTSRALRVSPEVGLSGARLNVGGRF